MSERRGIGICHFQDDIINISTLPGVILPDLGNKNTGFLGKFEFRYIANYFFT